VQKISRAPRLQRLERFERFELLERLEPAVRGYLNSGITFSANHRMFVSAISHGKLK